MILFCFSEFFNVLYRKDKRTFKFVPLACHGCMCTADETSLFSYLKAEFIFMILSLQLHEASVTSLFTSRIFGSIDKQCLEYTWEQISIHIDLILHVNYLQCKTPWTQSEPTLGSPCSWSCPKSLWKAYACIGLNAKCSIHLHSARHWLQLSEH